LALQRALHYIAQEILGAAAGAETVAL